MPKIEQQARQTTSVDRVSEGAEQYLKLLRDGALTVAGWIAALSLEGRVFTANSGLATTTVEFGAGGLATNEFDLHVAVPASVVIIPLELNITYAVYGTAALVENVMQSGSGSVTGSGTAITSLSSNVSSGISSACTVTGSAVAGTALTTNIKEIYRSSEQIVITITTVGQVRVTENWRWKAMKSGILDIVGPSQQLAVYAASNAGTGFISLKYIELPVTAAR